MSNLLRREITQQIVLALESNIVPWRRPFRTSKNSGRPTSISSGRAYSGVNPLLLELHSQALGLQSKWWATYAQWKKLGGQVLRRPSHVEPGQWGCRVIFFKPVTKRAPDPESDDEVEDPFYIMRCFTVFNVDQVDGDHLDKFRVGKDVAPVVEVPRFAQAEQFITATGADVRLDGSQAYYKLPIPVGSWPHHTDGDYVVLPPRELFVSPQAFYETAFHELAHWSEVRLGWKDQDRDYALCELVAELASCYLAAEIGVPTGELTNHAAYLNSWLAAMRESPSFIFRASSLASKTTDFLLSFIRPAEQPADELVTADGAS